MADNVFNLVSQDAYNAKMDQLIAAIQSSSGGGSADALSCIHAQGAVPYGKELEGTWAEIQAKVQAGDFSGINIGDYKTIELTTGETVICEVAGIDIHYNPSEGYYPCDQHHIDFISRDCISGLDYVMYNSSGLNNGTSSQKNPFMASELYQTLNNTESGLITQLPEDLRAIIINKRALMEQRYSSSSTELTENTGWGWVNMGPLWLPTEYEVFGHCVWSDSKWGAGGGGCNIQYPIFQGGLKHILKGYGNGGGVDYWWLASALAGDCYYFCLVGGDGCALYFVANDGFLVPLCFRIG